MKVILLERGFALGGLATLGLITDFLPLCDGNGKQVIGGIPEEFFRMSLRYGPGSVPDCWKEGGDIGKRARQRLRANFNPAWFQLALEELLLKEGVQIIYDSRISAVRKVGARLTHVIVENKSGRCAVACKVAIDATGDAELCFLAGEETVSLDDNRSSAWFHTFDGDVMRLHIMGDSFVDPVPEGSRTFSGDNWKAVTEHVLDTRALIRRKLEELPLNADGRKAAPVLIPGYPLIRRIRRLRSAFSLSLEKNIFSEDIIGMTGYYRKPGFILYIPYRVLPAVHTDNILAAGRCISCENDAWHITRGIPSSSITGQAAGCAAALYVQHGKTVKTLDSVLLGCKLREQGVLIH